MAAFLIPIRINIKLPEKNLLPLQRFSKSPCQKQ
jgi:hypothetical protein